MAVFNPIFWLIGIAMWCGIFWALGIF